jgi:hypothetical protein
LRDFDIAARNEALANPVGEQGAFKPAAVNQRCSAHHHARANQAAHFASHFAWLLLGKAKAKALEKIWWRLVPIKYNAAANRTCVRAEPDSLCDCV